MAKRFVDTGLIDKQWYQDLSLPMKVVWRHLCDACDCAGIWDINISLLQFQTGAREVTVESILKTFGKRVEVYDDKLYLTGFVAFHYGELNPGNNAHKGVLKRLQRINLKEPLTSPLCEPLLGRAQDKDKDKDKDKKKERARGVPSTTNFPEFLRVTWNEYCGEMLRPVNELDPDLVKDCTNASRATPNDRFDQDYWPEVFQKVMDSQFLVEKFNCSFSWALRNHYKIIRGEYDGSTKPKGIDWDAVGELK